MTPPLQNFTNQGPPVIGAPWLNAVDQLVTTVFEQAITKAAARTALTDDAPMSITEGGTGATTAPNALIALGVTAAITAAINAFSATITQAFIGNTFLPQTAAELAAGVTPTQTFYLPGDAMRFSPDPTGAVDSTAVLKNWAKVGGNLFCSIPATFLISSAIPLISGTTMVFAQGTGFTTATHDISMLSATSMNDIEIHGVNFTQTSAGTGGAYTTGAVAFTACSNCTVQNCLFTGMQWAGVLLLGTTGSKVLGNTFQNFLGTIQDASDISCISTGGGTNSSYNIIDGNFCFGANNEHGIAVWNPNGTSGVCPNENVVSNNKVGTHTGYGILIYMPATSGTNSSNQIIGNHVEGILGSYSTNTSSGAGIYVVGAGSGGTLINGNTIKNCCIDTANATLAPAGIGISGTAVGCLPVVCNNNTIEGMTQYDGILFTGVVAGGSCTGNTIIMPQQGGTTPGHAIHITNCTGVTVGNNAITNLDAANMQRCILFSGTSGNVVSCSAVANTCNGGNISQIECSITGGGLCENIIIKGNNCFGGTATCTPLLLNSGSLTDGTVSGNILRSGAEPAISMASCLSVSYEGNTLSSTGSVVINFTGTNTGCVYSKTNIGAGTGAAVNNAGTGLVIETYGTAAPTAGTWGHGDRVQNTGPAAGGVPGWYCTTAGTGGGALVFKAEGVLAS